MDLFLCDRRSMRLTQAGCARLWESAQDDPPKPHEGRYACRTCEIGAANAGKPHDPFVEIRDELKRICTRCGKVSSRIICQVFCPSCYNRNREVRIGRNRKGAFPVKTAARLRMVSVVVARGDDVTVEERQASGVEEVILATAKTARGPMSWSSPSVTLEFNGVPIDPSEQAEPKRRRLPMKPA